jgi:dihydrolipoamide dehydrogenase
MGSPVTANVILPSVIDTPANRASMPKADPGKWVLPERVVEGGGETVQAPLVVIDTGKSPLVPPISGLEGTPYLTYENVWQLERLPPRTLIVGGGYVGVELGQALARLGSQGHIVEMMERPVPQEEVEVSQVLGYAFFTQPQVGRAGLTLEQAQEQGYEARAVTLELEQVARATEVGRTDGFYRMVIDEASDRILGATLVGPCAAELIHVFIAHIEAGSTWQVLEQSVHIHPTFAEGLPSLARLLK